MNGTGNWFNWAKTYSALAGCVGFMLMRYIPNATKHKWVIRTYISRLLKKYAGKSFLEYLTDVRFQQVEKLIADNKYKQYEIAEMVGYKDFGYYIKVFKKRYGITPNEFRKYI